MNTIVSKRVDLYDLFRSIAIVNMVAFHFCFDYFVIFEGITDWYFLPINRIWQQFICMTFILVSGICLAYDRTPWKRGAVINGCGLIVTLVTLCIMPQELILFGILTFFGCAVWIGTLLKPFCVRIPPFLGAAVFLLLFGMFRQVNAGFVGVPFTDITWKLPQEWYSNLFTAWLGFPAEGFVSADYFAILPWIFWYLFGVMLGNSRQFHAFCAKIPVPSTKIIADKSLMIYMLHQPVCYAVAFLMNHFLF